MAWITKKSASAAVPPSDKPFLTPGMQDRLRRDVLPRFETRQAALLPALHEVQHEYGWIPPRAMMEVAEFLGLKPADVIDTASFYEEYWLKPKGRTLIQVCRSIACEFCGQPEITDAVRRKLGIDVGETTDDGRFTLIELECLGACDLAPAALIDHTLHERLTPERIERAIDEAARHENGHHH
jgi:NADH-quinone oxidoreductase subunit E